MSAGPTLDVDGKKTVLHYFTGEVVATRKHTETRLHSSTSYGGHDNNQPVTRVSSSTVDHHELILSDGQGKEKAFQMVDMDIACREGNTVSVIWAIPEGVEAGPYLMVQNHSTGERRVVEAPRIVSWFRKPKSMTWGAVLGTLAVTGLTYSWILGMILMLVVLGYFSRRANQAAKGLLASRELRQLEDQLAQVKSTAA